MWITFCENVNRTSHVFLTIENQEMTKIPHTKHKKLGKHNEVLNIDLCNIQDDHQGNKIWQRIGVTAMYERLKKLEYLYIATDEVKEAKTMEELQLILEAAEGYRDTIPISTCLADAMYWYKFAMDEDPLAKWMAGHIFRMLKIFNVNITRWNDESKVSKKKIAEWIKFSELNASQLAEVVKTFDNIQNSTDKQETRH